MRIPGLLATLLVLATPVCAELYKGIDAQGNVVYSDTPFEDAAKYKAPPISVVGSAKDKAAAESAEPPEPKVFKYTDFDIVSPEDKQTIWNEPELNVSLRLKPALNEAEEHSLWLLLDGNAVVENSQSLSMSIGRVERGAHKLQAEVRDANGKVIVRTRTAVVFIQQASAR